MFISHVRSPSHVICHVTILLKRGHVTSFLWKWNLHDFVSLWTGLWSSGELGRGKSEKACRQTFGTAVPRHPLCIRSWCKFLLARTLTVDRSDWHRLFGRHVARVLITKWKYQNTPKKAITNEGTTRSSQKTHTIFRKTLGWSLPSYSAILHSWCSFGLSCIWILPLWICKLLSVIIFKHSAKRLTSCAQRDTTFQKNNTFTNLRKSLSYSDPEGALEKSKTLIQPQ